MPHVELDPEEYARMKRDYDVMLADRTRMQEYGTELTMENRKLKASLKEAQQQVVDMAQGWDDEHEGLAECQAKLALAKEDIGNLETTLKDMRVTCAKCGADYPIDEKVVCDDCIQKVYQMQCESCGDNIPPEDGCYCEDCHGNEADLELRLAELERLLGQAVVEMNKAGKSDSPWMKRYKKLHEKYLHQTPTGKKVDLDDELFRMKGARNELENQKRELEQEVGHLKAKLACSQGNLRDAWERLAKAEQRAENTVKMFDDFAESLIDELEPHFYDRNRSEAQAGADYDQITEAVRKLVSRYAPRDFQQQLEMHFLSGMSDAAIAERYNMSEGEYAKMLIALARVNWESRK